MSRLVDLYNYFSEHMDDPYPAAELADRKVDRRLKALKDIDYDLMQDLDLLIGKAIVAHEIRGFALGVAAARGEGGV